MKSTALIGVILIVLGVVGFAFGHIDFTTKERVVDFGPVHVDADKKHTIAIPDIAAAIALIAGVGLVLAGQKRA
jgi:hypothetical protein